MCVCQREQDRKREGGRHKPRAKLWDYQTQDTMEHKAFTIWSWNIQGLRLTALVWKAENSSRKSGIQTLLSFKGCSSWMPSKLKRVGGTVHPTNKGDTRKRICFKQKTKWLLTKLLNIPKQKKTILLLCRFKKVVQHYKSGVDWISYDNIPQVYVYKRQTCS